MVPMSFMYIRLLSISAADGSQYNKLNEIHQLHQVFFGKRFQQIYLKLFPGP